MADFEFLQNKITGKWVILAPRRAHRPGFEKEKKPACPFCPGRESDEPEVYRVGGEPGDSNWQIRVVKNKYPFAQIHEIIIHSPDHHKNFGELSISQAELIIKTYRERFRANQDKGMVYIFHNRGEAAGESLSHPHTQLVVIPKEQVADIPPLDKEEFSSTQDRVESRSFYIFAPRTSQWPDEVWLAPRSAGEAGIAHTFGQIEDSESSELADVLSRIVQIFSVRHGHEFSFNFYIYPSENWYLRLIPRVKILGGFEVGTEVFVNTQDPKETLNFIKDHFEKPDIEEIKKNYQASYKKAV